MTERTIFLAAIEIADPTERLAYLDQACASDAALRSQVEELLKSHAQGGQFLESPRVDPADFAATVLHQVPSPDSETRAEEEPDNSDFLQYLQPSTRPGWLGRLGHYEIESIIGRGAFGIVAKAFDEKLHRVVAIKMLSPELASSSPPRKRFLREARTAAAMRHENVVGIHAVEEQPLPYLVMEYIPGPTLSQKLHDNGPLDVPEILNISQQIAAGLAAAHAVNLIHRDIKPSNILLEENPGGKVKISDFGLARAMDDASMTTSGMIAGTPMYMSPEQAKGETLDHRTDLFSLGSVMYQMTSGRPPFRAESTIAVLRRVCDEAPRPIQDVIATTPDWLCAIIDKLLAKDANDRYQSAREVSDLLLRCQRELERQGQVTCVPVPVRPDAAIPPAKSTVASSPSTPPIAQTRSKLSPVRLLLGLIGVAVVVALAVFLQPKGQIPQGVPGSSQNLLAANSKTEPVAAVEKTETTGWHGWPADAPKPAIAPFDAEQAKKHQAEWAAYLKVPVEYTNSIGMKFRLIPPGEFTMGSTPEEIEFMISALHFKDDPWRHDAIASGPRHHVVLTQPYYLGTHEVTQAEFTKVSGFNPSYFSHSDTRPEFIRKQTDLQPFIAAVKGLDTANHPVEGVLWTDTLNFLNRLSRDEQLKPNYSVLSQSNAAELDGNGYRLPTEAQWEFACRAGTTSRFPCEDVPEEFNRHVWSEMNSGGRTHPVGELRANAFGLRDMIGHVREMVNDGWNPTFYQQFEKKSAIDPHVPPNSGLAIVHRGGDLKYSAPFCLPSTRFQYMRDGTLPVLGFRALLSVDAVKAAIAKTSTLNTVATPGWHGWPADAPKPAITPFDAEQAKKHQAEWAAYLKVPVEYTNPIGMKFRLIPPGEFLMGSTPEAIELALKDVTPEDKHWEECIASEAPQHQVILTQPIYLGVNEVTQAEYEKVTGGNPSHFAPMGPGKEAVAGMETAEHPVETVSWNDAAEFCAKLSKQEKLKPFYFRAGETITPLDGTGYRLPSDAGWEFACRAGTATKYWIGDKDEDLVRAGWFGGNSGGRTHAAGELKANPFGLSDIHGNVWEWVQDGWDASYYGQFSEKPAIDPNSPFSAGSLRVIRGGDWHNTASPCRSSDRNALDPSYRYHSIGFRLSLTVDSVREALKVTGPALPKAEVITPSAPAKEPIDFAAERKAAEAVLALGGSVELESEQGQPVGLVDGKLPDVPFALRKLELAGKSNVKDDDLTVLQGCRRLQSVNLVLTSVNGAFLRALHPSRASLTWLDLAGAKRVTDERLAPLAEFTSLRLLNIAFNFDLSDDAMVHLSGLTKLESLHLPGNITDAGVRHLAGLRQLRELYSVSKITDAGLAQLYDQNPQLERVGINDGLRTVAPLAKLRRLRHAEIDGRQLSPDGLRELRSLPQLESIKLFSQMTGADLARLAELPQLRHIEIFYMHGGSPAYFGDAAFKSLATLPNLEGITVYGHFSSPSDAVLDQWSKIPTLQHLSLNFGESKRQYTPAGIAKFREARPDVRLYIDGKDYPPTGPPFSVIQKLDETDPLPKWELPEGSPPPVVAPCKPEEATALQQKWAEHLKRPVVEEVTSPAGLGLKFALIPPGEFRKIFTRSGDPAVEPDMPVRRFRITKPYAVSTTEVTWDQFRQFVEATGYKTEAETNGIGGRDRSIQADPKINWRTPGWKPEPNEPVTQVTPKDAEAFCAWLSKTSNAVYRLPTEAEWVHACRAGSVYKHVVGPDPEDLADYAWTQEFLDPNPQANPLHLVARKKPNPFGLHDTLGNVWEYTRDCLSSHNLYELTNDPASYGSGTILGSCGADSRATVHPDWGVVGWTIPQFNVGFRVLQQFDAEPLPGPLDRPLVLRPGQPMSVHALVPRPEKIPDLRTWSIELAGAHTWITEAIAASPKGDLIATGSTFGKISLWNRDGKYQRSLLGHEGAITSLDFSRDGRWLASTERVKGERGNNGSTTRIWNVDTGELAILPINMWGSTVRFSPDSTQLAICTGGQLGECVAVSLKTGRRQSFGVSGGAMGLAWSPDGNWLACLHWDGRLRVWHAKTLKVLREVVAPASHSLEWSPDGQWLALRAGDGKVSIRDAQTLEVTKTLASNVALYGHALAWLPDSKRLIVAQEGSPSGIFDVTSGEELAKCEFNESFFYGFALLANGAEAVSEGSGRLHFYDTSTGKKLREGKRFGGEFAFSEMSREGREIFTQIRNNAWVHDSASGELRRNFPAPIDRYEPKPSPEGKWIGFKRHFGASVLPLVDAQTGIQRHEFSHGQGNVTRVEWSPDGRWLATGATDKLVRVWNVATGKVEHELAGHTGTISSLAWSPDGSRLATAAEDKTVRLWNPLAGKLVATYDQFPEAMYVYVWKFNSLAWTADGRRLWIALTNNVVPLDVESGTFGPLENLSNGGVVMFLNMSPDGQRLLAQEFYGWTFVRGRDAQDRHLLGQHLSQIAQWHPDSRRFLGCEPWYGTVGFDVETNRRLGMLFPWLTGDHWLCIGPTGHYRGSPGVEEQIVYVVMHEDGSQRTYTPKEFAEKFGWKNDPEKATLLKLDP